MMNDTAGDRTKEIGIGLAVSVAAGLLLLPTLGLNRLLDADELTHARAALEAARDGHWLPLYVGGQPWWEKPPLMPWCGALLLRLGGPLEFTLRMIPCLGACLALGLFFRLALRICSKVSVSLLLTVLLFANEDFLYHARFFSMDTWLLATYFGAALSVSDRKWRRAGLWLGLAAALKSWFALAFLPAGLAVLFWNSVDVEERDTAARDLILPPAIVLIAWLVLYRFAYGAAFLSQEWSHNLWGRMTGQGHPSVVAPWSFYPGWVRLHFPLMAGLAAPALAGAWAEVRKGDAKLLVRLTAMFLSAWGLGMLAVQTPVFHYFLPWAGFAVLALAAAWSRWSSRSGVLVMAFTGIAAAYSSVSNLSHIFFMTLTLALAALLHRPPRFLNDPSPRLALVALGMLTLQSLWQAAPFYLHPPDYNRPLVDAILLRPVEHGQTLALRSRPTQAVDFYSTYKPLFLRAEDSVPPGVIELVWKEEKPLFIRH